MGAAKILISLPSELNNRFKSVVPARKRSQVIRHLIKDEIKKREAALYQSACAVEADLALNEDINAWDITIDDGMKEDESW